MASWLNEGVPDRPSAPPCRPQPRCCDCNAELHYDEVTQCPSCGRDCGWSDPRYTEDGYLHTCRNPKCREETTEYELDRPEFRHFAYYCGTCGRVGE